MHAVVESGHGEEGRGVEFWEGGVAGGGGREA